MGGLAAYYGWFQYFILIDKRDLIFRIFKVSLYESISVAS